MSPSCAAIFVGQAQKIDAAGWLRDADSSMIDIERKTHGRTFQIMCEANMDRGAANSSAPRIRARL